MSPVYRLWFTNFHYYFDGMFFSLDLAVAAAKTMGFEVEVHRTDARGTEVIAAWSPIGGLRDIR